MAQEGVQVPEAHVDRHARRSLHRRAVGDADVWSTSSSVISYYPSSYNVKRTVCARQLSYGDISTSSFSNFYFYFGYNHHSLILFT